MTNLLKNLTLLGVAIFLSACSSVEVSQDFSPQSDFSKYKSFEWLPADKQTKPKAADFEKKNELIAKRITDAITREMTAKGLSFQASGADAYITYHISSVQKIRSSQVTTSIGHGRGWGYGGYGSVGFQSSPEVRQYEEGQLIIDILDKDGKLVWRGKSSSPVQEHPTPEETSKLVNEHVQKLLAQYPPKKK